MENRAAFYGRASFQLANKQSASWKVALARKPEDFSQVPGRIEGFHRAVARLL
jgi:hypothetical protein